MTTALLITSAAFLTASLTPLIRIALAIAWLAGHADEPADADAWDGCCTGADR